MKRRMTNQSTVRAMNSHIYTLAWEAILTSDDRKVFLAISNTASEMLWSVRMELLANMKVDMATWKQMAYLNHFRACRAR